MPTQPYNSAKKTPQEILWELSKENAELKAENAEIKTSYINFVARLNAEMITKEDIQDLKNTVNKFVEEHNSLIQENKRLKEEITELEEKFLTLNGKSYSYYTTLQEIKEIAEKYMFLKPDILTLKGDIGYLQNDVAVEILQKITKAEEE